jgi:hypothetical protein
MTSRNFQENQQTGPDYVPFKLDGDVPSGTLHSGLTKQVHRSHSQREKSPFSREIQEFSQATKQLNRYRGAANDLVAIQSLDSMRFRDSLWAVTVVGSVLIGILGNYLAGSPTSGNFMDIFSSARFWILIPFVAWILICVVNSNLETKKTIFATIVCSPFALLAIVFAVCFLNSSLDFSRPVRHKSQILRLVANEGSLKGGFRYGSVCLAHVSPWHPNKQSEVIRIPCDILGMMKVGAFLNVTTQKGRFGLEWTKNVDVIE